MKRDFSTYAAMVLLLAAGITAGYAIERQYQAAAEEMGGLEAQMEIQWIRGEWYGRKGILKGRDGQKWQIAAPHPRNDERIDTIQVSVTGHTEWKKIVIASQLPMRSDGTFIRDDAIKIEEASVDDFAPGDEVYAGADENVWGRKSFEAARMYKIIYQ